MAPAWESLGGTGLLNESCLATAQRYTKTRSHQVSFSLSEQDETHKYSIYNSNGNHSKLSEGIWTPTHADDKPSFPVVYLPCLTATASWCGPGLAVYLCSTQSCVPDTHQGWIPPVPSPTLRTTKGSKSRAKKGNSPRDTDLTTQKLCIFLQF